MNTKVCNHHFSKVPDDHAAKFHNRAYTTLQTDKELEFLNRSVKSLLREHSVHNFSTHNEETKAGIVEMFHRTPKTCMWRYFTKRQDPAGAKKRHVRTNGRRRFRLQKTHLRRNRVRESSIHEEDVPPKQEQIYRLL